MTLEEKREAVGTKIYMEHKIFEMNMLNQSKEEIYSNSYRINTYVCLYEFILEMCQELWEEELEIILKTKNILAFLYDEWLSYEDSSSEELMNFIKRKIKNQEH